jgi:hypothetical protein
VVVICAQQMCEQLVVGMVFLRVVICAQQALLHAQQMYVGEQ